MSTFLHLLTFGVLTFGHLAMAAWLIQVGARWAQADGGSFWRAVGVLVLMTVVVAVADWGFGKLFGASIERSPYAASLMLLAMNVLLSLWVVQRAFRVSLGQAFQIWLPTLVSNLVFGIASIFFVVPYLVEAFKVPTNSMAPAILGRHLTGDCPLCGGRAILPASSVENGALPEDLAICTACWRVSSIPIPTGPIQSGDRLLVSKPIAPRRWDIIVYRRPSDPSTPYVTRLIGVPAKSLPFATVASGLTASGWLPLRTSKGSCIRRERKGWRPRNLAPSVWDRMSRLCWETSRCRRTTHACGRPEPLDIRLIPSHRRT